MLTSHMDGCTPFTPCVSCQAVAFLREKLSSEDFNRLAEILHSHKTSIELVDELSVRCINCLANSGITTINDLLKYSEAELLQLPNFGRKQLNEIREFLNKAGLKLKDDVITPTT